MKRTIEIWISKQIKTPGNEARNAFNLGDVSDKHINKNAFVKATITFEEPERKSEITETQIEDAYKKTLDSGLVLGSQFVEELKNNLLGKS